jgi:hypothetical protein
MRPINIRELLAVAVLIATVQSPVTAGRPAHVVQHPGRHVVGTVDRHHRGTAHPARHDHVEGWNRDPSNTADGEERGGTTRTQTLRFHATLSTSTGPFFL